MFLKKALTRRAILFLGVGAICVNPAVSRASVVWYINDYDGWTAAAGDVHTIDFQTLPDGSPSIAGTLITPDFNYTAQGVTFLGHASTPFIGGNDVTGFGLSVDTSPNSAPDWITAELVTPARAVATRFPGDEILSIFDGSGNLIDTREFGGSGVFFLGAVSDIPISFAKLDRDNTYHTVSTFYSAPVPEPATVVLLGAGAFLLILRCTTLKGEAMK